MEGDVLLLPLLGPFWVFRLARDHVIRANHSPTVRKSFGEGAVVRGVVTVGDEDPANPAMHVEPLKQRITRLA